MRTLSRIECFNVGCTNEASVTINGDHVCTQCANKDLPNYLHKFLPVPGIPEDEQFLGSIAFPCKIQFTIVPYVGMPRSLVHDCADQAQCDSYIDYYMSDTTGNTRKVMHTVYVAPQAK